MDLKGIPFGEAATAVRFGAVEESACAQLEPRRDHLWREELITLVEGEPVQTW